MARLSKAERRRRRLIPTRYGCWDLSLSEAMWKPPALERRSPEREQQRQVHLARRWYPPLPPMRPEDIW